MTVKDITMENVNLEDGIVAKIGDKYIQVQVGYDNIESESSTFLCVYITFNVFSLKVFMSEPNESKLFFE